MPRKLTTEEFIEKARAVHGNRYDYSQVEYSTTKTPVTIVCRDHGPFRQSPAVHIKGHGCPECGTAIARDARRHTKEQFVERAVAIFGDLYDYSEVDYVNNSTNVTIICPAHGPFQQRPHDHLQGKRCLECSGLKKRTTKTFVSDAKKIHGGNYDYSRVVFSSVDSKVVIICPEHGAFEQSPHSHLRGRGCPVCAGNLPLTYELFVQRAKAIHGDHYDYSKVDYANSQSTVEIVCPVHGPFMQRPHDHLQGKRCAACAGRPEVSTETFVQRARMIHGDRYDYSEVEYRNNNSPVTIICLEHGPFSQRPSDHLQGKKCAACAGRPKISTEIFIEQARAIHGDLYDYSLVQYVNAQTKVKIVCPDHGVFTQTPSHHIYSRAACPDCAVTGFNPTMPGILYYLAIATDDGDTRYKIGITNTSIKSRFPALDLARIRVVRTWRFAVGRHAAEREAEILRNHVGDRYFGPPILQSGNTELFTHDVLGLDTPD